MLDAVKRKMRQVRNGEKVLRHYLRWPYPIYKPMKFDDFNHEHTCIASRFCKALQMIKEQGEINDKFEDALDLVGDGFFVYGANNKYYEALLLELKDAMNDQYEYIDWWHHDATDDKRVWSVGMEKE